jgi:hypothetical protein
MSAGKLFFVGRSLVVALVAAAMIASPLSAQQDKQSQTGKTSAKDSNIKNNSDSNSATVPEPATTTRRAARAHGGSTEGTCEIRIHNFTYLKSKNIREWGIPGAGRSLRKRDHHRRCGSAAGDLRTRGFYWRERI